MNRSKTLLLLLVLPLSLLIIPGHAATHYTPREGDSFTYHEVIDLNEGTGAYEGYTEHQVIDGTETMTTVYTNGTIAAHYSYTWSFSNTTSQSSGTNSGDFSYSSTTYHYTHGTDNQTGYTNPYVWFYINNMTTTGDVYTLLNTQVSTIGTHVNYKIPFQDKYVYAIQAQGSSSYQRNDVYGIYTAPYTWTSYFDPRTGYIIGYLYSEHDNGSWQGQLAGFTWTDTLSITQSSYSLTAAPRPLDPALIAGIVLLIILAFVVAVIAVVIRNRRRLHPLPEHPVHQMPIGVPQYSAPPPTGPPQQGIDLTPKQQPPVQQIVIKEVVKVKCKYCGALIDGTAQQCPFCGAPRT